MERLTRENWRNPKSMMWEKVDELEYSEMVKNAMKDVLKKLAEYEDLGLEPNEIKPYIELTEKMNVCDLIRENKRLSDKIKFLESQKQI